MKLKQSLTGYNLKKEQIERLSHYGLIGGGLLVLAYLSASMVSAVLMNVMMDSALKTHAGRARALPASQAVIISNNQNYREVMKAVLARNIFNSEGTLPEEADPIHSEGGGVFDAKAACQKTTLPITLLGTIFLGSTNSLATIKDSGYSEADIYRSGDVIYGSQAKIYAVEPQKVIINNNGTKECLELTPPASVMANINSGSTADGMSGVGGGSGGGESFDDGCGSVTLEANYVEKELGQGFANILSKGRLVPHNKDNVMKGFKLIGVDPSSLFGKVCLKNEDVITEVNGTNLQQPEQGFTFYQAFQDDREIRISILRGETPKTITVRIK